jgi:hypothetical protein
MDYDEYLDFINHLFLARMLDEEYQQHLMEQSNA